MVERELKFFEAIREGLDVCLTQDPSVRLMGLGVPDPKGVFGTTLNLHEKHGTNRVFDTPTSENAVTGIALGAAITGLRPVLTHQRLDFTLLAMDQMVNQAAKWHYMFGGKMKAPLVIRMIVGRGWGQGPQHSQSLQSWFAHVPGLKVVMPATPSDAKGLLISSIEDNNPVIYIEHRWLHNLFGHVPAGHYRTELGKASIARSGKDITIAALSYMVPESLRAAECLEREGISAEVIDIRSLRPLDLDTILGSVRKTGHLIVADTSWEFCGFSSEVIASVSEHALSALKSEPRRLGMADVPVPTSPALSMYQYPGVTDILKLVSEALKLPAGKLPSPVKMPIFKTDVPDSQFTGPF
jgi:acetoin:2,6-dichlorophenolindophenol oxidoreductase subunit beta